METAFDENQLIVNQPGTLETPLTNVDHNGLLWLAATKISVPTQGLLNVTLTAV